jgi:lysophospholipase L1-like esterase
MALQHHPHQGRTGWAAANGGRTFDPRDVPQIAAGEFWLPNVGVSGAGALTWAGRNGTNNLVAPASGQNPDQSTGPSGQPDWTYVAANSDNFVISSPASPLTATDGVYVACWFRFDSLDTTNRVIVEQHGSAGSRKWHIRKTASLTTLHAEWSDDGTNLLQSDITLTEPEGSGTVSILDKYLFLELLIDPAGGSLATKTRLFLDLQEKTWDSQSGTGGAALFNGGVFRYGNNNFENQDFNGRLGPLYVGKKTGGVLLPSYEQRFGLMQYLSPKARTLQVICDGNSLTQGQGASVAGVTSYPGVLRAALGGLGYSTRDVHDSGHGGDTTETLLSEFPTGIAPFFDPVFARSIVVMFEVRNSSVAGKTAAQILASYQSYGAAARAAGFRFIAGTAPPTDGDAVGHGVAGAANALIRANWPSFADGLVDLELVPQFTPAGDIANPTYYSDGVHMTDAGYALIASKVQTAVLLLS